MIKLWMKSSVMWAAIVALMIGLTACGADGDVDLDAATPDELFTMIANQGEFTVEANGTNVERVVWSVDETVVHTSTEAPFRLTLALSDYPPGVHEIRAVVTLRVLGESSDVVRTVSFTVGGVADAVSWTLIDAATNADLGSFSNDAELLAPDPTAVNLRLDGAQGPITFYLDGQFQRRENEAPFSLFGDVDSDYLAGDLSGSHTVRAVAGDGTEHLIRFKVSHVVDRDHDHDGGDPPVDPAPPPVVLEDGAPRLLTSWGHLSGSTLRINGFRYVPSNVVGGPYDGFDRLHTRDVNRDFRFQLGLARDATVVMAWPQGKPEPDWASDWTVGPGVTLEGANYKTFTRVFSAGTHALPMFGRLNAHPTFLIGEADGRPSVYPTAPSGLEQPRPNEVCPAWVHDLHVVQHEGKTYRTWHPQLDPTFGCTFQHEHGSDPASFAGDWQPLFDRYVGIPTHHGTILPSEAHVGFKVFVTAPYDGVQMMATLHSGSSELARVCVRHHATDKVFADAATGEILANLAYKGDFGWPRLTAGGLRLDPRACPDAIAIVNSGGRRDFKGPTAGEGYEPWLEGLSTAAALPFSGKILWVTDNPQTKCGDSSECNSVIPVGVDSADGTRRWFDLIEGFSIDATSGSWGTFCTDAYGAHRVSCGAEGAVEQYIKPGFRWAPPRARFSVLDPFSAVYEPRQDLVVFNIIRNINGGVPLRGDN